MLSTIGTQKQRAAESIAAGWALFYLCGLISHQFITAPLVLEVFRGTGLGPWKIALANAPDLILPFFVASMLLARLHPRSPFEFTCAFAISVTVIQAAAVGWLLMVDPPGRNTWVNLLNVLFTLGLMVAGGVAGADPRGCAKTADQA